LHSVPSSDALVFHYLPYNSAKRARKSGIAADATYNGVPLSLRHPYAATSNDFEVFGNEGKNKKTIKSKNDSKKFPSEEVLVLSLPRQFLDRLPGYEDDAGLCMISADVLRAMFPPSFTAVVDDKPWLDRVVMLPPQCILRSLILMYDDSIEEKSNHVIDFPLSDTIESTMQLTSVGEYLKAIHLIRQKAFKHNLTLPLL
jgi:hypothetical protein